MPMRSPGKTALVVSAGYFLLGATFILTTDRLLYELPTHLAFTAGTVKGLTFVFFSAAILLALSYYHGCRQAKAMAALLRQGHALIEAEKRSHTAMLAATVSHDINNIVSAMNLNIKALLMEPEIAQEVREIATDLDQLSDRLVALTGRLRPVERQALTWFRPDDTAADIAELWKRSRRLNTPLQIERGPVEGRIYGNPTLLEQLVGNLLVNASDAVSDGSPIVLQIYGENGAFVLTITDKGCGISPEAEARIWDALYTTKPDGTGLGLAIVREAVDSFGGSVDVNSTQGKGTTFRVELPLVTAKAYQSHLHDASPFPLRVPTTVKTLTEV